MWLLASDIHCFVGTLVVLQRSEAGWSCNSSINFLTETFFRLTGSSRMPIAAQCSVCKFYICTLYSSEPCHCNLYCVFVCLVLFHLYLCACACLCFSCYFCICVFGNLGICVFVCVSSCSCSFCICVLLPKNLGVFICRHQMFYQLSIVSFAVVNYTFYFFCYCHNVLEKHTNLIVIDPNTFIN